MTEQSGPTRSTPAPPAVTSAAPSMDAAPDVFAPPFTGSTAAHAPSADADGSASPDAAAPPMPDTEPWTATDEEGTAEPAWDTHETLPEDQDGDFPLDAFIIPDDARTVPAGVRQINDESARFVADRLSDLAARIRTSGLGALAEASGEDALAGAIANAVALHLSRNA
jgi:hypothetical protein